MNTAATKDSNTFAKLRELIKDINVAMITTVAADGSLRSRPMVTRQADADGEIWFFTADDSGKVDEIAREHHVGVSYAEPKDHRYVSVTGVATIVHDREQARSLWHPSLKTYFPRGLDDPQLALLRVRAQAAEYWDAPSSKMVQLYEMTKAAATGERADLGEHRHVDVPIRNRA